MDSITTDCAPFDETVVLLSHSEDLNDPPARQGLLSAGEILLLCLPAVLGRTGCFTEISLFGVKKLDFHFRPSKTAPWPGITSVISSRVSIPSNSNVVLLR